MTKKADRRRQKRRQKHQTTQASRRQEVRRLSEARIAAAGAVLERFVTAAADPGVAPDEVASTLLSIVADDELVGRVLLGPEAATGLAARVAERAGAERARALAAALGGRLAAQVSLCWLAVSLAEEGDDLDQADRIAARALEELGSSGDAGSDSAIMAAERVRIHWLQGRLADAMDELEVLTARWPDDEDLMALQARMVARAAALGSDDPELAAVFADQVDDDQKARAARALERFADRSLLYRLRQAVEDFIQADPALVAARERWMAEFAEEAADQADLGAFDEIEPGVADLAAERFWLTDPTYVDAGRDDADDPDDDLEPDGPTVLELFAGAPATPAELADAARSWSRHALYGLWLAEWPYASDGDRGIWVTDIVTRRRVYATFAPEQLAGIPRWAVQAAVLAPVGGVWRSGQSLLSLDPDLADEVAESLLFVTEKLLGHLARQHGMKPPRTPKSRRSRPRPHGVLCDLLDEMEPAEADLTSKVVAGSLAQVVGLALDAHHRGPQMRNTDGEPVELISAVFPVDDPDLLRRRLLGDVDFDGDDPTPGGSGVTLRWLGRPMTAEESAGALAQFRATARQEGWGDIEPTAGPQRWLRGTVTFEDGALRAEVNSRARLEALSTKLRRLGAGDPTLERRLDPALDLPQGQRLLTGRSLGADADAAWMEQWVTEKIPALEGSTPTRAAADPRRVVLLERLLRRFEHDADLVVAAGEEAMDFALLRERLGMHEGVLDRFDAEVAD